MKLFSLCAFVVVGALAACGQMSWSASRPAGCEVLHTALQDGDRHVSLILLRCDPKQTEIRLVNTSSTLGAANAYAAFSLREVLGKTGAEIVVNAGSTASFSAPIPAGLLEVNGTVVGRPKYHVKNAGILCISRDHVSVVGFSSKVPKGCVDAVQRGPLLAKDLLSSGDDSGHYRRTVAAVDDRGRLVIVVTKDGATLSAVASFLYLSNPELGVTSALNLDGGASSGLIFADNLGINPSTAGNVDGLVASAIVLTKKR